MIKLSKIKVNIDKNNEIMIMMTIIIICIVRFQKISIPTPRMVIGNSEEGGGGGGGGG